MIAEGDHPDLANLNLAGRDALPPGEGPVRDPRRAKREENLREIVLPLARAGRLPFDEAEALRIAEGMTDEEIGEWAGDFLRQHPWPVSFYIPTLPEFASEEQFLGERPLTKRQVQAIEDSIGLDARKWFIDHKLITTLILCWGKGSGKDTLIAILIAYIGYVVGAMRNPWFHFDVNEGEPLDVINVAAGGEESARDTFFTKLRRMVERPCFGKDGAKLLDQRPGRGSIKEDRVTFRKRIPGRALPVPSLRILSLNSKNEAVEGKNIFAWVMDEADAFQDSKGHGNALKMFNSLQTSNRFGSRQLGIIISYPRSQNGFMFECLKKCANRGGATPEWWGDLAPTWEVLPWKVYIELDNGTFTNAAGYIETDRARLDTVMARMYREDPETFRSMYACEPPAAANAWISVPGKIDEAIQAWTLAGYKTLADIDEGITEDRAQGQVYRYVARYLTNFRLRPNTVYFVGGDAGLTGDSFAIAIAHVIPRGERGFISPGAWRTEKRWAKHYTPEPIPVDKDGRLRRKKDGSLLFPQYADGWDPNLWRCDWTGEVPDPRRHDFWGVCWPSGQEIERPVIERVKDDGEPVYKLDPVTQEPVLQRVWVPVVVEDLVIEWQPDKAKGLTVDFRNVKDLVILVSRAAGAVNSRIGMAKFDRWGVPTLIQEIRGAGIPCDDRGFSVPEQFTMYRNYKALLYNNLLRLLPNQARRDKQLRELALVNGRIDHPEGGAKDIPDAEAIAFELAANHVLYAGSIDVGAGSGEGVEAMNRMAEAQEQARNSIVGGALRELAQGRRGF